MIFSINLLVAAWLLAACTQETKTPVAQDITAGTVCVLDGMLLQDYPGPKAQIHYSKGEPDFFCDTVEMFSIYLRPEQQKRVTAMFTQDMGKADWAQPQGHWIDAKKAFYVYGSKRIGSMGPTFAAFADESAAQAFVQQFGGKILRFDQITLDMTTLDGGVLRDEKM